MIRKYLLVFFTLCSAILFLSRLFYLQIIDPAYKSLSDNNAILERSVYPERGLIYDRKGTLLVANQPAYDLMYIPENSKAFDTTALAQLCGVLPERIHSQIKKSKRYSYKLPSVIVRQLSKETHAAFQEKIWQFPGFYLQKRSLRDYKVEAASNVLGYISEVNRNDLLKNDYYALGELIGRQGIEKQYETSLRGEKGKEFFQKDRFNKILGPYENKSFDIAAKPPDDITLTLDIELQSYGEQLLQNKRGGIVAIEPQTGEILALVSAPNYNPNLLVGRNRSSNYRKLAQDTLAKPLFDRGLQAQYAPGSPFKTLNALIALQEGTITTKTKFKCNQGHYYARGQFMKCHCRRGTQNRLIPGIYKSCNTYFAQTYRSIIEAGETPADGLTRWKKHLNSFGLGNYLGYDLPIGKPGFIPDSSYYHRWYGPKGWKAPTIISNAIGQGEILTTPIQMANFTAAIANRGYYIRPHFVKKIGDSVVLDQLPKNQTTISKEHFDPVIEGMELVVEKGTARTARIKDISVCGKTGTVENFTLIDGVKTQLTDHSMFIAFAPKEDPKIAIAVFIENGYWGARWAAPIASLMIEKYLTGTVKRSWWENRMFNGSLEEEYLKPLSGKPFTINE